MPKNRYVTFGDIIVDKSTGTNYVAVNATQALNKKRKYLLCLELTDKHECLHKPPVPIDRSTMQDFNFVSNMQDSIKNYLNGVGISFNCNSVYQQGFTVRRG